MPIRALALAAAAAVALTTLAASPASASADPGVVRVHDGWLRGSVAADHVTYSVIPYAAPPTGERRWRPPAKPQGWRGIRDATQPSPLCPQGSMTGAVGTEDCLYLDVTVPRNAGKRLPVVVWLYGGGFTTGGAQQYDATRLATSGELIVVTPNYRLGALGFLAAPALGGGGNYGLMDQAAALRWVRQNVARFGGDPRNVTLAGQSAGARSVCAQLASPHSRGLYQRAITQSGACENAVLTPAKAQAFGAKATEDLGCATAADIAACLRSVAPERLLPLFNGGRAPVNARGDDRPWGPVAGTSFLPRQPGEAIRKGTAARVPLLVGGTRDEMRGFVSSESGMTEERYRTMLVETFGAKADLVLAKYPASAYDSPALALATVLSDWGGFIGACPVLRTAQAAARHQRVYAYEFAEDSRQTEPYPLGAYHSLDLPYVWDVSFPNNFPPLTAEQRDLSAEIIDRWAAFAHTGSPNWPSFDRTGTVLGLTAEGLAPTPYGRTHHCDFWRGLPR